MTASDPRVFFAAERTLLAWVRSGLTIIGLGFVVSRFALFLRLLPATNAAEHPIAHPVSVALGIALVVLGSLFILGALANHRRFVRSLSAQDIPPAAVPALTSILALTLSMIGLLLAAYLALS
jgi:putative membrane protein